MASLSRIVLQVNSMIGPGSLSNYEIRNFTTDWNDGQLLLSLIDAIRPGLVPGACVLPLPLFLSRSLFLVSSQP